MDDSATVRSWVEFENDQAWVSTAAPEDLVHQFNQSLGELVPVPLGAGHGTVWLRPEGVRVVQDYDGS